MEHPFYEPSGLALDIFRKRYAIHPNETFGEACERVAYHIAQAEQGEKVATVRQQFLDVLRKNLFFPGGRIMFGSGRPKGQLLNCFVVPTHDSREGWGKTTSDTIVISGVGGGVGTNYSPVRPRGSKINGAGGIASGAVSLMRGINAFGEEMKNGGGRRVALMMTLRIDHGDIVEFLDSKLDLGKLNNANVSVNFEADPEIFFERVKRGEDLELKHNGKVVGRIPAKKIWSKIVSNALKGGEPGLLNGYLANRMSNIWYYTPLISTNPCITGDSLIAVADGRNAVSIEQLATEGKDVPVYSMHPGTGKVEIKWGMNPRKTGEQREIWRLTLDDGSAVRATPDHRFYLSDMTEQPLRELKPGNSIAVSSRWKTSWDDIFKGNSRSQDYWMMDKTGSKTRFEHSLVAEFNLGRDLARGEVVHHWNFDGLDNSPNNLEVMTKEAHDAYHSSLISGENNPYHRMDDEWKRRFASHPGEENGMFGRENKWGHHTEEAKDAIRQKHIGVKSSNETRALLSSIRLEQVQKKYADAGVPMYVKKTCPGCGAKFTVHWQAREQTYCSKPCFLQVFNRRKDVNDAKRVRYETEREQKRRAWLKLYTDKRFELGRDLRVDEFVQFCKDAGMTSRYGNATFKNHAELKEAASAFNHRVVSVEFDGYEDVYNMTVEDNHNYAIVLPVKGQTKNGKEKQTLVFTPQCGEIWLAEYDCCCLGSIVLPRFVDEATRELDWEELRRTVFTGIRFLDNVLSVNNYPLPEIKDQCSNLRRIGLGTTGLHDMLLKMGMRYNSAQGLEFVDRVWEKIKHWSYEASTDLAEEKGSFPKFDPDKFVKSGFCKTLKPSLRERIKTKGMRNCAVNTVAPVGTGSMVSDTSSGIEPMFAPAYRRRYRDGDALTEEVVIHPLFKRFMDEGLSVKHFQGAHELKVKDHFEMQRTVQRHVDNAVSKTINVPPGVKEEELSELYMEYFPELKGVTIYPDGSREDQPLTPMDLDEAVRAYEVNAVAAAAGVDSCRDGKCDI